MKMKGRKLKSQVAEENKIEENNFNGGGGGEGLSTLGYDSSQWTCALGLSIQ